MRQILFCHPNKVVTIRPNYLVFVFVSNAFVEKEIGKNSGPLPSRLIFHVERHICTYLSNSTEVVCGDFSPSPLSLQTSSTIDRILFVIIYHFGFFCRFSSRKMVQIGLRDLFSCSNWFPLYQEIAYNAICYNGASGFAWIA